MFTVKPIIVGVVIALIVGLVVWLLIKIRNAFKR